MRKGRGPAISGTRFLAAVALIACARELVATGRGEDNEPPGMNKLTERPFSSLVEDGWGVPGPPDINNYTIVTDQRAPKSGPSVGAIRFPAGFQGGTSPALSEKSLESKYGTLYISAWIKISSNWVGHPTGTNKVFHFWIADLNRVFAYIDGSGTNTLQPYIGLQAIAVPYYDGAGQTSTSVNLRPNVAQPGFQLERGKWYHWEMLFVANTNGGADGTAQWWINGVQVGNYTGIPYVSASQSRNFNVMRWDPTWGGLGGQVPADQYMYLDHIYVSGKP
jgi:hypothetical protein